MIKSLLLFLLVIVVMVGYYALFGVVFADLWRMSFAAIGLPAITSYQAAVGALLVGMVIYRNKDTKVDTLAMFIDLAAKAIVMLIAWGTAYLLGWIL